MYNIFKINVLKIICLNDFTEATRRRGPNLNRQAAANLLRVPASSRIRLQQDEHTLKFIDQSTVWFATECGIIFR